MVAVGFALSCFAPAALPLGHLRRAGPVQAAELPVHAPTSPRRSRSPRRPTCASAASSVGKVKEIELPPRTGNADRAPMIEIEPEYAPISSDARAILRQKTLLGETYVELTTGSQTDSEGDEPSRRAGADRRRPDQRRRRGRSPIARGRAPGRHPGRRAGPDRRDLQRAGRGDPQRLPALDEELRRSRSRAAASTSTTPSATSGPSPRTPATCWRPCASRSRRCATSSATRARCSRR